MPMADMNRVEVEILGHTYAIRSQEAPDYVRRLAAHVERRAREVQDAGSARDPVKLLALAALHIADELFRLTDEQAVIARAASARLGELSRLLDSVATEIAP